MAAILAEIRLVDMRNKIAEMLVDLDATIELGRPPNGPVRGRRDSHARAQIKTQSAEQKRCRPVPLNLSGA
jgi:hypothetical protein